MKLNRQKLMLLFVLLCVTMMIAAPAEAKKKKKKKKAKPKWKTTMQVGLETIYDSNFLRYSEDYLEDFESGMHSSKYKMDHQYSLIAAPSFRIQTEKKLLSVGKTRFIFKYKLWKYEQDVKTNMGFDYYIRQYLPGGTSVELKYNYAPSQYIRELSDHPVAEPHSAPVIYDEFRYVRNQWNLYYRGKLNKRMSYKFDLSHALKYYNQIFMENDINDWGIRTTLSTKLPKKLTLTLDYQYLNADARGHDQVTENAENSNDSSPGYKRDMFQADLNWKPSWSKKLFDSVSVRARYAVAYFTSTKSLEEDPYHVGRKDNVYTGQLRFSKKINKSMRASYGFQRSYREVESPWHGDIYEDKNYDQDRYWFGLTYTL